MTTALEGGEGSASRPAHSLLPGKTRYLLCRRLGGPQGRSGQVGKISPPTGIRSPDRPARSQSLYRLRYPAHKHLVNSQKLHTSKNSINNIQRNAQIFQYTVLHLKSYVTHRFRFFMDNLQGGNISICDVQNIH